MKDGYKPFMKAPNTPLRLLAAYTHVSATDADDEFRRVAKANSRLTVQFIDAELEDRKKDDEIYFALCKTRAEAFDLIKMLSGPSKRRNGAPGKNAGTFGKGEKQTVNYNSEAEKLREMYGRLADAVEHIFELLDEPDLAARVPAAL